MSKQLLKFLRNAPAVNGHPPFTFWSLRVEYASKEGIGQVFN